jgi:tripeptide aminopeptidase
MQPSDPVSTERETSVSTIPTDARSRAIDSARVAKLADRDDVRAALALVLETDALTMDDQVAIVAIPAPPFGEAARARWILERFLAVGLADGSTDAEGNVLARLPGDAERGAPPVLISAHLDTIFPAETPCEVRQQGDRIVAPGIADNARGLAALVAIARALVRSGARTRRPIVFAATVGEEGVGDLRGVKHLFREGSPWREAAAFVALDGTGRRRIVHKAIGARRLRVVVSGPGGHSWADWGRANPIHALGEAIAQLIAVVQADHAPAALTVGRIGGGTSVNAIPDQAWLELDLRSEDADALSRLEVRARAVIEGTVRDANARRRRGTTALSLEIELIGDRPTGEVDGNAAVMRIARAVTRHFGDTPELVSSSTDANIPIALGIPALALGAGGEAAGTHTLAEWYRNDGGPEGVQRALLTVLALAELL